MRKYYIFSILFFLFFSSCKPFWGEQEDNVLLAEVFNKKLYSFDMKAFIPENTSAEDSIMMVSEYVDRWTREAIMLHEAEKNMPDDWNIDALVENYRSSLIRHQYEQILIQNQLDSIVTDEELQNFYERNKEQYELETPIVRAYVIKLARSVEKPETFGRWWEDCRKDSLSYQKLRAFSNAYAETYLLEDSTWYSVKDLNKILPSESLTENNIRSKKYFTQRSEEYEYFYKSFDIINKKEIAPLAYIEDQARRFILTQRKQELLQKKRKEMFQDEFASSNVKIYTGR